MFATSGRLGALRHALEDVKTRGWSASVDYMDFDDASASFDLSTTKLEVIVRVSAVLVRDTEVLRIEEPHRFPITMDPQQIAANILIRLQEYHDAVQGKEVPAGGVAELVRNQRLEKLAMKAAAGDMDAAKEFLRLNQGSNAR